MNNPVKRWDKRRDTTLLTLRTPATPQAIRKFLKEAEDFGEVWDEQVRYDPQDGWLYVEFEMGTSLVLGGNDEKL